MSSSNVLDLVIGLLFIFMIFSLVASGVYETGARIFATRSRTLWKSLSQLLDPEIADRDQRPVVDAPDETTLTGRLYAHPLIRQLEGRRLTNQFQRSRISHIPNTEFARALIDIVVPAGETGTTLEDLRHGIGNSDVLPAELKQSLLAIVADTQTTVDQVRSDISGWFDARMAILSKYYKRNTRWVMVAIGVAVTIAFNVDAIGVAGRLYQDDALRAAVSAQATAIVETCQTEDEGPDAMTACIETNLENTTQSIDLPVGWTENQRDVNPWRLVGWLIGGVAIAQGAPFWFDLLRRASSARRSAS